MWNGFLEAFQRFTLLDALDIAVVAFILYQAYRFARGTRALPMLWGIVALAALYAAASYAGLLTTSRILETIFLYLPFVIILVFQSTIRRALAAAGVNPLRFFTRTPRQGGAVMDDIVLAVMTLAARRRGALILLERAQGLRTYIETGVPLDARLSYDLLVSIFAPDTPLHDGAVIVQEDKIAAAACYLPLTLSPSLSRKFGTRHRAAIGATEETDAVAIVVSEERGSIALVVAGEVTEDLDADALREHLRRLLHVAPPTEGREAQAR